MSLALLYFAAYLLGSIPFAVIIGKINHLDVLSVGSGNPGMTNVGRNLGRKWGAACFVLDFLKGFAPAFAASKLFTHSIHGVDPEFIWFSVGFAAIVGHCASIFLKFKGGKGISTAAGAIAASSPVAFLICVAVFALFLLGCRYVSLSSVFAVASTLVTNFVLPSESRQLLAVYVLLTLFVIYRHRKNFVRIKEGKEPRVKFPWER
ncbi:MAG TPA: glycerol-3-phosphate 1-O-acyltransferase PlsY [Fimbriimonas sp.]|nr:glycerol-3-phosphate 1-O-acyltransferase PlsY [Fimbriimonas sp.]